MKSLIINGKLCTKCIWDLKYAETKKKLENNKKQMTPWSKG